MVIVLLNVLIAQVSDTYAKVLETAEGYKLFNQCLYIAQLEQQNNKICMNRGIYLLVQKFKCCTRFYNCCCQTAIIRKVFEYFKGVNVSIVDNVNEFYTQYYMHVYTVHRPDIP